MRLPAFALCTALLLTATPARAGNLISVEQDSAALGRRQTFDVFVPAGEAPPGGWPVLYLLHGAYGCYRDWTKRTEKSQLEFVAEAEGVMLVLPDGGEFGWYLDSPTTPHSNYETRIIDEIIPSVDRAFATRHDRGGRGICGLSMGGHGAISLAAKHPDLFSSASSLSGILVLQNHRDRWELAGRLGVFEDSPAFWHAHSCIDLAPRLVNADIRLLLDCGVKDTHTGAIKDNRQFHLLLNRLGVPHTFHEYPGTHSWGYWGEHVAEHIRWHAEGFRRSR
jgi:S-formylglutathione hydrolase FrmB